MGTRPFVLVGGSQRAAASARVRAACERWRAAWGVETQVTVRCAAAGPADLAGGDWRSACLEEPARAWIESMPSFAGELRAALFGPEDTPLAREASALACADLVDVAVAALRGTEPRPLRVAQASPDEGDWPPGSGALATCLELAGATLRIVLPHGEWLREAPPQRVRAGPRSTEQALAGWRVPLEAVVGSVDLPLAAVRTLAPGDVVRLGTRLDAPLVLSTRDGHALCHGHLGASEGRRALELVP